MNTKPLVRFARWFGALSLAFMLGFKGVDAASPQQVVDDFLKAANRDPRTSGAYIEDDAFYVVDDIGGFLGTDFMVLLEAFAAQGCSRPIVKETERADDQALAPAYVVKVEWNCQPPGRDKPPVILDAHFFVAKGRIVGARIGDPPPNVGQLPDDAACRLGLECMSR